MAVKPKQTTHSTKHRSAALRQRAAKTKEHFSRHYYSLMPEKKHHRVMVWMVFLLVTSTIAAQMMYPINHALPFARLGNQMVGWQTDLELQGRVNNRFAAAHVRFSSENTTYISKCWRGAKINRYDSKAYGVSVLAAVCAGVDIVAIASGA